MQVKVAHESELPAGPVDYVRRITPVLLGVLWLEEALVVLGHGSSPYINSWKQSIYREMACLEVL